MNKAIFFLLISVGLVACNGDSRSSKVVAFDQALLNIVDPGNDSAEPLDVENTLFRFSEDPSVFDGVFQ